VSPGDIRGSVIAMRCWNDDDDVFFFVFFYVMIFLCNDVFFFDDRKKYVFHTGPESKLNKTAPVPHNYINRWQKKQWERCLLL